MSDPPERARVHELLHARGGLREGTSREVARATGVPEAHVYGAASFYHLLAEPDTHVRVCQGLTCAMAGSAALLERARALGLPASGCSCLAACDRPVAVLRERDVLGDVTVAGLERAGGDHRALRSGSGDDWLGCVGPALDPKQSVFGLAEPQRFGAAIERAHAMGPEAVIEAIAASGLQGRGGAGFPAAFKWRAVSSQPDPVRHVVLNADEGEPGTFKDREVLLRRPDLVVQGLAIAAYSVGASDIWCYLRGEFGGPWRALEAAIAEAERLGLTLGLRFHLHAGHGAYICGEETALLEALEGGRGMPRLKPPFPTERGLWGKPTLIHNVETIACVPSIVERGPDHFRGLGRTGPGPKLYSVSGHVARPGVYELPLGVSLDELVAAAFGYVGELKAFSPGGASSGFLPAAERTRPLDFRALADVGSMLGSAGVVVCNTTVNMAWAAREQLAFFEAESCGQCAPCRIGTRFLHEATKRLARGEPGALDQVEDVAWQMNEGSICGLGQTAALPLTSALRWFPEEFES